MKRGGRRIERVSIGEDMGPRVPASAPGEGRSTHIRGFLSFGADRGRLCVMADDRW